ncbi:MAG TPA: hypothetical protein ENI08_01320 [Candidatus Dependentiae bacterium]|nr:hypothetical protein [Candidatus Dependentiae bacterium]
MRIYYGGKIIKTDVHVIIPKITFEIGKGNRQNRFYFLVTPTISYDFKKTPDNDWEHNTIAHLKVPEGKDYKFYVMDLIEDTSSILDRDSIEILRQQELQNIQSAYHWEVHEEHLPENGKIPDATIIVCFFPEFIENIKGGSHIELPTIVIKSDIINAIGSEKKLHEESIKLQLASLNSDTIHAKTKQEVKSDQRRTLIMNLIT